MSGLLERELLIDLVLAVALLECIVLGVYRQRTGRGPRLHDIAANLAAGLCLMAALRVAISSAPAAWVALPLLGAGVAHAVDLRRRWRR